MTVKGPLTKKSNISTFDDLGGNTGLYDLKQVSIFYLALTDVSKKINQDKKGVYIMTTEEKLNQTAGTIK